MKASEEVDGMSVDRRAEVRRRVSQKQARDELLKRCPILQRVTVEYSDPIKGVAEWDDVERLLVEGRGTDGSREVKNLERFELEALVADFFQGFSEEGVEVMLAHYRNLGFLRCNGSDMLDLALPLLEADGDTIFGRIGHTLFLLDFDLEAGNTGFSYFSCESRKVEIQGIQDE